MQPSIGLLNMMTVVLLDSSSDIAPRCRHVQTRPKSVDIVGKECAVLPVILTVRLANDRFYIE